jgi:hypothetical protein
MPGHLIVRHQKGELASHHFVGLVPPNSAAVVRQVTPDFISYII